jgi:hypothetical protein
MDICSLDADFDNFFWTKAGPKDESTTQFIRRHFHKFCEDLTNPVRHVYEPKQLAGPLNSKFEVTKFYDINEFNILSNNASLHCCLWKKKKSPSSENSRTTVKEVDHVNIITTSAPLCLLYLHTNTRSLVDALEVIELAHSLDAHLVAMDLPGCGKSEGKLHGNFEPDIMHLMEWTQCLTSLDTEFVIWARGMSTAPAIDICASASICKSDSYLTKLKCVILDSPFTGIDDMIKDGISNMETKGYSISKTFIQMLTSMVMRSLKHRMDGFDLMQVRPLDVVSRCHLPCFILSADADDYIPVSHGIAIKAKWAHPSTQFTVFPGGKHFGVRPSSVVAGRDVQAFIARFTGGIAIEMEAASKIDTNGSSYKHMKATPNPSGNGSIISSGIGIGWKLMKRFSSSALSSEDGTSEENRGSIVIDSRTSHTVPAPLTSPSTSLDLSPTLAPFFITDSTHSTHNTLNTHNTLATTPTSTGRAHSNSVGSLNTDDEDGYFLCVEPEDVYLDTDLLSDEWVVGGGEQKRGSEGGSEGGGEGGGNTILVGSKVVHSAAYNAVHSAGAPIESSSSLGTTMCSGSAAVGSTTAAIAAANDATNPAASVNSISDATCTTTSTASTATITAFGTASSPASSTATAPSEGLTADVNGNMPAGSPVQSSFKSPMQSPLRPSRSFSKLSVRGNSFL